MKCPNCGSSGVQYLGTGFNLFMGLIISGFGFVLSFFLIGIPLLILGLLIILYAIFGPNKYRCSNCKNTWPAEKENIEEETEKAPIK